LLLAAGCSIREAACGKPLEKPTVLSESEQAAAKGEELPRVAIAVLGDSLTAGFGLLQAEAFPALLQGEFDADGYSRIDVYQLRKGKRYHLRRLPLKRAMAQRRRKSNQKKSTNHISTLL
jgi:lysophospholipase L1-like esterase